MRQRQHDAFRHCLQSRRFEFVAQGQRGRSDEAMAFSCSCSSSAQSAKSLEPVTDPCADGGPAQIAPTTPQIEPDPDGAKMGTPAVCAYRTAERAGYFGGVSPLRGLGDAFIVASRSATRTSRRG